jgi:hypothetical protein
MSPIHLKLLPIWQCVDTLGFFYILLPIWLCFFHLASSHHHFDMNFYYIFLLLLGVLPAYSESPQYGKPPDSLDLGYCLPKQ